MERITAQGEQDEQVTSTHTTRGSIEWTLPVKPVQPVFYEGIRLNLYSLSYISQNRLNHLNHGLNSNFGGFV